MNALKVPRLIAAGAIIAMFHWGAGCDAAVYVRTSGIAGDASVDHMLADGPGNGGSTGTGGTGGQIVIGSGGIVAPGTGGGSAAGSGGRSGGGSGGGAIGGATATGGVAATGGMLGTGGVASTGGVSGTGGIVGTGGVVGTGGIRGTGGAGTGGAGTGGAATTDTAKYNFETSTQSWVSLSTPPLTSVSRTASNRFAGQGALSAAITATGAALYQVGVPPTPAVPAGATITFHVFFPAGSTLDSVQPYALAGGTWTGNFVFTSALTAGAWNTINVVIPAASAAITQIGVQFRVTAAWTGTVYVDSVTW